MTKGNTNLILGVLGAAGVGAAIWYFSKKKGEEQAAYTLPGYAAGSYVPETTSPVSGQGGLPMPGGLTSPGAFYPAGKDTSSASSGGAYGVAPIFQPGLGTTPKQKAQLSTLMVPRLIGQATSSIPAATATTASKADYGMTAAVSQTPVAPPSSGTTTVKKRPSPLQLQLAAAMKLRQALAAKGAVTKTASAATATAAFTPKLF